MRRFYAPLPLTLVLAWLAGCSAQKKPFELVHVKGTVSFQGQPLSAGDISFLSADGSKNASSEIKDGQYELSTFRKGDGVAPGDYKVSVTAWQKEPEMGTPGVPSIPAKYLSPTTSELTANIKGESDQVVDFALSGDGG